MKEGGQETRWPEVEGEELSGWDPVGPASLGRTLAFTLSELGSHCTVRSRGRARSALGFQRLLGNCPLGPCLRKWLHSLWIGSPPWNPLDPSLHSPKSAPWSRLGIAWGAGKEYGAPSPSGGDKTPSWLH